MGFTVAFSYTVFSSNLPPSLSPHKLWAPFSGSLPSAHSPLCLHVTHILLPSSSLLSVKTSLNVDHILSCVCMSACLRVCGHTCAGRQVSDCGRLRLLFNIFPDGSPLHWLSESRSLPEQSRILFLGGGAAILFAPRTPSPPPTHCVYSWCWGPEL